MKKKICIFLIIITIAFLGILIYGANKKYEGYEINKVGNDILLKGELLKHSEYHFRTFVQLNKKVPLSFSILEININTKIELDKDTNKYILKNTKFEVTPIGCIQNSIENEIIDENGYSGIYTFGVKPNQEFKQLMDVGCAKLLLDNAEIKINNILSVNFDDKIDSVSTLKKTKNNSAKVTIEYSNSNKYYDNIIFRLKFKATSCNEGIVTIN